VQKLRIIALSVAVVALLAGCAGSNPTLNAFEGITPACDHFQGGKAIDSVEVTLKDAGAPKVDFATANPKVSFASALSKISKPESKIVSEGNGPVFTGNELVLMDYAVYSSTSGKLAGANKFDGSDAQAIYLDTKTYPVFCNALSGVKQGSVVALAVPSNASNPGGSLYVFKLLKVNLPHANGAAQSPVSGLPQVVRDPKTGRPGLVPPSFNAPTEFKSAVLIEGKGEVVKSTDSVTIHYSLWNWTGALGGTLESSWDSQPITLNLATGSIVGLGKALTGVKVGSQVIASMPPADAYGATGSGSVPANATLLFVIDVLGTDK